MDIKDFYDTVIVGAGPGGMAAARVLAEAGREVIIFEKNKVVGKKVCAGGLTFKDLEMGVPPEIISKRFDRIIFRTESETKVMNIGKMIVSTIDREELGKWQLSILRKLKVPVFLETPIVKICKNKVVLENGKEIKFNYLIGADGTNSLVRKFLNISLTNIAVAIQYILPYSLKNLEMIVNIKRYGSTYVWIFPHKDYTSIGSGLDVLQNVKMEKLRNELDNFLKERKLDKNKCRFESAPINFDYQGFNFGNIFLIGDAAGFTPKLTAEGIYNARVSGEEVARKIINPEYDTPKINDILKYKERQEKLFNMILKVKNADLADKLADFSCQLVENAAISRFLMETFNT